MHIKEATNHTGQLPVGDLTLSVSILKDGTPVIGYGSAERFFGLESHKGTFFPRLRGELAKTVGEPIHWQIKGQKRVHRGFEASILYKFAKTLVRQAKFDERDLSPAKQQIIERCWALVDAFGEAGVRAVCYDAAGYLAEIKQGAMVEYFNSFLVDCFKPWAKRFDYELWREFYRVWGKEIPYDRPIHEGAWLSKLLDVYVYGVMPREVIDEIKTRNPYVKGTRFRQRKNHQHLSDDVGDQALMSVIAQIKSLLKLTPPNNPAKFKELHKKVFHKPDQMEFGFGVDL